MNDNTAEQLKCREAFELYANDINDKTDRIPLPLGKNPIPQDFYIDGDTDIAFEDFKAGWKAANSTRADSGEAVAWQVRCMTDGNGYWMGWGQCQSEEESAALVKRYEEIGRKAEWRPLYTHPSATSLDADCQLLPKGWRIKVRDNGRNKGMCVFSPDGSFAISGETDHKSDIRQHVINLLGAALSQRVEKGNDKSRD